jgi:hypothetical protein
VLLQQVHALQAVLQYNLPLESHLTFGDRVNSVPTLTTWMIHQYIKNYLMEQNVMQVLNKLVNVIVSQQHQQAKVL